MSGPPQIITLTTDFGTQDGYVGALKGKLLSVMPTASIHDVSHDIPPQNIGQGAWCLRRAAPRFPPGTVHLAVVDPGVGSTRGGLVIETEHYLLVGPDNGVLSLAARDDGIVQVVEIGEEREEWHKSANFDGLTLFAPVAGYLMAGMPLDEIGPEAEDMVEWPDPDAFLQGSVVEGTIILFDRFGNAITNILANMLEDRIVEHIYLNNSIDVMFANHYAEFAGGDTIGGTLNSDGRLELAIYGESIQEQMKLEFGDTVRVLLRPL